MKNTKLLTLHLPIDLHEKLQKICEERKEKGFPNGTMRFVVCEAIQEYLQKCQNENR